MELERLLSRYAYAEVRIETSTASSARIADGEIKCSGGTSKGIGVRVLEKGAWGFASGNKEGVEELLERAKRLAHLRKGRLRLADIPARKAHVKGRMEVAESQEMVLRLEETAKDMQGERVRSRIVSCTDVAERKEFHNSQGAGIVQETGYSYLSCTAVAKEGGLLQRGSGRSWSRSGLDGLDFSMGKEAADQALRLLEAEAPPKGRFTVVFDPEMTGVFSHEAVGHACEADAVSEKESILSGMMGKRIGSELVTITDDPGAPNFGHYAYDDEGVEGRAVTLIQDGAVRGFMDSRESAHELGIEPNGHARAEDFEEVPVVRMSNTYFKRGESSRDEVFDVPEGVYLKGMRGGSVDIFSGGFMFKAAEAFMIEKGGIGRILRDTTVTGNILETLLNVEAVGKDFGTSPGMCGKAGQSVPVSDGGPHIRVKGVAIG